MPPVSPDFFFQAEHVIRDHCVTGVQTCALPIWAALGALRFWKPISVVLVALLGGFVAEHAGVAAILPPLTAVQTLAVVAALLIHERGRPTASDRKSVV